MDSYYLTFFFLFFTFLLAFEKKFYIIALVNLIASFMYYQLIFHRSIKIRYIDWILTTPLLLYELSIIQDIKDPIVQMIIQISNICMLYFGWLGEVRGKKRNFYCLLGFIPLVFIFALLYKPTFFYYYFFILWIGYGLVYLIPKRRNIYYNILDILSKSIFGILYLYSVDKLE